MPTQSYLMQKNSYLIMHRKSVAVIEQYEGRFLVRGGEAAYREGDAANLDVIVEFPSFEKAKECVNSPEYKNIESGRKDNMTGVFVVVEGV